MFSLGATQTKLVIFR